MKKDNHYRIFIIDGHPVLAAGLRTLVEKAEDMEVCGCAGSVEAIPAETYSNRPDVFMVDIYFKVSEGFEILKQLQKLFPQAGILVFSMQDETFYAERTLQSGARGYIMMSEPSDEILHAVRQVASGNLYVSERLKTFLFSQLDPEPVADAADNTGVVNPIKKLTNRELQVIELIGQGKDNREISSTMNIRLKTVEAYRFRIKEKLNLRHSTELIQFAIHWLQRDEDLSRMVSN